MDQYNHKQKYPTNASHQTITQQNLDTNKIRNCYKETIDLKYVVYQLSS